MNDKISSIMFEQETVDLLIKLLKSDDNLAGSV
jgi:hypothetical protein